MHGLHSRIDLTNFLLHVILSLKSKLTQKSTKGDSRRQCSKVDEDDGGQALRVQSVSDVAEVLRIAAHNVFDQTSEEAA